MNTWIVCGNQSGAKIFICKDLREGIKLLANHPHPQGRLKEHDLVSDHGGQKNSSSTGIHGTSTHENAKNSLIDQFSKQIAHEIDLGIDAQECDALIVCADPKFLGKLRNDLSTRAQNLLSATVNENFYNADMDFIWKEVKTLVGEAHAKFKLHNIA